MPTNPTKLEPCRVCGSECSVQVFTGEHIEGEARVWMCPNNREAHRLKGKPGTCSNTLGYLTAEAWNEAARHRLSTLPATSTERAEAQSDDFGDVRGVLRSLRPAFETCQADRKLNAAITRVMAARPTPNTEE